MFVTSLTIMDKSLGTLLLSGHFPIHMYISRIFSVSTLYRVGGGKTARTF